MGLVTKTVQAPASSPGGQNPPEPMLCLGQETVRRTFTSLLGSASLIEEKDIMGPSCGLAGGRGPDGLHSGQHRWDQQCPAGRRAIH